MEIHTTNYRLFILLFLFVFSSSVSASLITNIENLDVDGTSYNVTFYDGSFNSLWDVDGDGVFGENDGSIINSAPTFLGNRHSAIRAAESLINTLGEDDTTSSASDTFRIPYLLSDSEFGPRVNYISDQNDNRYDGYLDQYTSTTGSFFVQPYAVFEENIIQPEIEESIVEITNFDSGDDSLIGWIVEGNGTADIVQIVDSNNPQAAEESVLNLHVDDPEAVTESVDATFYFNTPDHSFDIGFDYLFTTPNGHLELWLGGFEYLDSIYAIDQVNLTDFISFSTTIDEEYSNFWDNTISLTLRLFPGSESDILMKDITLTSRVATVPEPATLILILFGLTGIVIKTKRKNA